MCPPDNDAAPSGTEGQAGSGSAGADSEGSAAAGEGNGAGGDEKDQRIVDLERQLSESQTQGANLTRVLSAIQEGGSGGADKSAPSGDMINARIQKRIEQVGGVQTMREYVKEALDLELGPMRQANEKLGFHLKNPDASKLEPFANEILEKMEKGELTTEDVIGLAARAKMSIQDKKPVGSIATEARKPGDAAALGITGSDAGTSPGDGATKPESLYGKTPKERRKIMRDRVVAKNDSLALEAFDRDFPIRD